MKKVKITLTSGVIEKPVITAFKGTYGDYIVLDNETIGSMGLPVILISKIQDNKLLTISDTNEWNAVKENLRNIIAGNQIIKVNVGEAYVGDDIYYKQLTLPVASFDVLKATFDEQVLDSSAPAAPIAPEAAPAPVETPVSAPVPPVSPVGPVSPVEPVSPVASTPEMPAAPTPAPTSVDAPVAPEMPVPPTPEVVPSAPEMPMGVNPESMAPDAVQPPVTPVAPATPVAPEAPEAPEIQVGPAVEEVPPVPPVPPVDIPAPAPATPEVTPTPEPVVEPIPPVAPASVNDFSADKEAFLKACENMFDALVAKFNKPNQD